MKNDPHVTKRRAFPNSHMQTTKSFNKYDFETKIFKSFSYISRKFTRFYISGSVLNMLIVSS